MEKKVIDFDNDKQESCSIIFDRIIWSREEIGSVFGTQARISKGRFKSVSYTIIKKLHF